MAILGDPLGYLLALVLVIRSRRSQRFVFVDALRGLAAMWVLLFHTFESKHMANLEQSLPEWTAQFFHTGHMGVIIFFVLSGFVIAHSVDRSRVGARYAGWFMLRRAVRLDPPYWASILVIILFSRHVPRPSALAVLAHMFYLQDLLQIPAAGGSTVHRSRSVL